MKKIASMLMHMYLPNLEVKRCDEVVNTTYHETNTCTWLIND